jgi:hypothetical protein
MTHRTICRPERKHPQGRKTVRVAAHMRSKPKRIGRSCRNDRRFSGSQRDKRDREFQSPLPPPASSVARSLPCVARRGTPRRFSASEAAIHQAYFS